MYHLLVEVNRLVDDILVSLFETKVLAPTRFDEPLEQNKTERQKNTRRRVKNRFFRGLQGSSRNPTYRQRQVSY